MLTKNDLVSASNHTEPTSPSSSSSSSSSSLSQLRSSRMPASSSCPAYSSGDGPVCSPPNCSGKLKPVSVESEESALFSVVLRGRLSMDRLKEKARSKPRVDVRLLSSFDVGYSTAGAFHPLHKYSFFEDFHPKSQKGRPKRVVSRPFLARLGIYYCQIQSLSAKERVLRRMGCRMGYGNPTRNGLLILMH